MEIDAFLASEANARWTKVVLDQAQVSVFPLYGDVLQQATMEQLLASGCALNELLACGQEHEPLFLRQVVALVSLTAGAPLEQAYGPGDGGPISWKPSQVLGVSRDFLVPHLIVFFYLLNRPEQLAAYLKKTRNVRPDALAKTYIAGFQRLRAVQ